MKKTLAFSLVLTTFAAAALAAPSAKDKVLATFAGTSITQYDIDQAMAGFNPQQRAAYSTPEAQQELLNQLIDFRVLAQSGRDQKLQNTPEYKEAMKNYEEGVLFRLATKKLVDGANAKPVSDADAQKYYDEHTEIFQVPAAIRASHILIRSDKNMPKKDQDAAKKKAEDILRDIELKKTTFEEAAKNFGSDGTVSRGGDLGFFSKGQMVPEFEKAAFALKKGEMTKRPIKSEYGWHIIKLTDTRDASIRSFDTVKADITNGLTQERQVKAVQDELDKLKKRYDVKIMPLETPQNAQKN